LKTNFISGDNATLNITQTLPAATDLSSTNEATTDVQNAITATKGIAGYQVTVGNGGATNTASYSLQLDADADADTVQKLLEKRFGTLTRVGDLSIVEAGTLGASSIDVVLQGSNDQAVAAASSRIVTALKGVSQVKDVTSGLATTAPAISVKADGQNAARYGLTDTALTTAVAEAVEGTTVTQVVIGGTTDSVVVQPATDVTSIADLEKVVISTQTGRQIKLGSVATVEKVNAPAELTRTDGDRSNTISATPIGDDTGAASTAVQNAVDSVTLPAGVTASLGGATSTQDDAFSSLIIAMIVAVALVLLILLAVFGSFAQTAILLMSIPFAFTGAVLVLRVTSIPLGIAGLIGMLMLIGIVVTNAIVLMDRINQNRRHGMALHEAVLEGGLRRLRPILMTALATMIALVPMALGISGAGTFLSTPLAVVVIGGLFTSTLLTLVLIPVLYETVESARDQRRHRRSERKEASVDNSRAGEVLIRS
jgi:multidrug efflux pump subunit AcrB